MFFDNLNKYFFCLH